MGPILMLGPDTWHVAATPAAALGSETKKNVFLQLPVKTFIVSLSPERSLHIQIIVFVDLACHVYL